MISLEVVLSVIIILSYFGFTYIHSKRVKELNKLKKIKAVLKLTNGR